MEQIEGVENRAQKAPVKPSSRTCITTTATVCYNDMTSHIACRAERLFRSDVVATKTLSGGSECLTTAIFLTHLDTCENSMDCQPTKVFFWF